VPPLLQAMPDSGAAALGGVAAAVPGLLVPDGGLNVQVARAAAAAMFDPQVVRLAVDALGQGSGGVASPLPQRFLGQQPHAALDPLWASVEALAALALVASLAADGCGAAAASNSGASCADAAEAIATAKEDDLEAMLFMQLFDEEPALAAEDDAGEAAGTRSWYQGESGAT
jgi:hypothetical protein